MKKDENKLPEHTNEYVVITIAEDAMKATANFLPNPNNITIEREDIKDILKTYGITHGIQMDSLAYAALRCRRDRQPITDVVAALGLPPAQGFEAYYELLPQFDEEKKPDKQAADAKVKIDFRECSPFTLVHEDEILARRVPPKRGEEGFNVFGVEIPYETVNPGKIQPGRNTRADETGMFSMIYGQLVVTEGVADVEDNLVIKGSVDYSTGHIDFPGDVTVFGEVKDCFKLHSGGSIVCKQTLDASDVFANGDLTVAGGIIGRTPEDIKISNGEQPTNQDKVGKAGIKVNGNVKTLHITHCQFFCKDNIDVDNLILDSQIFSLGQVRTSDKAIIVGSEIYALHGVTVGLIENRTGRASKFHLGIDYTVLSSVAECVAKIADVAQGLSKLRGLSVKGNSSEKYLQTMETLRRKFEKDHAALTAEHDKLIEKLYIDDNAMLQVAGTVAAGTVVQIGRRNFVAPMPLTAVCFKLNEERTKILTEPYESEEQKGKKLKLLVGRRKRETT